MNAARRRVLSLAATMLVLVALRNAAPDPATRREWALLVMLPLGYGHQIAAVALRRSSGRRLERGLALLAVGVGGASFVWLLSGASAGPLIALLTAIAVWHVVENEAAMTRVGSSRLAPLSRSPRHQAALLLVSGLVLLAAFALPRLAHPALRLGVPSRLCVWSAEELIAGLLFYHVVSFLFFYAAPRVGARRPRGWGLRLTLSHALPVVVLLLSHALWPSLSVLLASPPLYLFCSCVHALSTVSTRGVEPA